MRPHHKTSLVRKAEEAGRVGGGRNYRQIRGSKQAENADIGGLRRIYDYDSREFGDNLQPLQRFLDSRVGKRWNKVRAELRRDPLSTKNGFHIWSHIERMVQTLSEFELDARSWWGVDYGFFIDAHGILRHRQKLTERKRPPQKKSPMTTFEGSDGTSYERISGFWFRTWTTAREVCDERTGIRSTIHDTHKAQLSSRDLKRLGLTNINCVA